MSVWALSLDHRESTVVHFVSSLKHGGAQYIAQQTLVQVEALDLALAPDWLSPKNATKAPMLGPPSHVTQGFYGLESLKTIEYKRHHRLYIGSQHRLYRKHMVETQYRNLGLSFMDSSG